MVQPTTPFSCMQVQMALSSFSATLQATKGRLDALEQMRIPTLEERLQEVSRTSAQAKFIDLQAFANVQHQCCAFASVQAAHTTGDVILAACQQISITTTALLVTTAFAAFACQSLLLTGSNSAGTLHGISLGLIANLKMSPFFSRHHTAVKSH